MKVIRGDAAGGDVCRKAFSGGLCWFYLFDGFMFTFRIAIAIKFTA